MSRWRAAHFNTVRLWDKDYETLDKKQPIFQGQAKHSVCPRVKPGFGGGTSIPPINPSSTQRRYRQAFQHRPHDHEFEAIRYLPQGGSLPIVA